MHEEWLLKKINNEKFGKIRSELTTTVKAVRGCKIIWVIIGQINIYLPCLPVSLQGIFVALPSKYAWRYDHQIPHISLCVAKSNEGTTNT